MRAAVLLLVPLLVPLFAARVSAQSAPPGWTVGHAAGGAATYTPPGLAPGQVYVITVFPRASLGGGTLEDRLRSDMSADPAPPGADGRVTAITRRGGVAVAGRAYKAGGQVMVVLYTETLGAGRAAQLQRVVYTRGLYERYKADMLAMVNAMARALGQPAIGERTPSAPPPAHKASASLPAWPAAPPGAGLKPSQVAGVYCQPSYGGGAGGMVSVSYEPVLVLKDGTYCGGFEVPPSDFDAAASRRRQPKQWGRWRKGGDHLEKLGDRGAWERTGWIGPLPPAAPGQRLSGTYTRVSGGGNTALGGGVMVAFVDKFTFFPDGRFRAGSDMGATAPGVAAGRSRSATGTYTLSGYAITLRASDSAARRWSYARTRDGLLFLHGDAYTKDDDK